MKFSEYELEIQLAFSQHPRDSREEEVYSLILSLMRDVYSVEIYKYNMFSIRDIHNSPPKRRDSLYGQSGYPDLAIYSQKLKDDTDLSDTKNNILGVIEAKAIGGTYKNDLLHILGEIHHFKKVIYTNGIVWIYYDENQKEVRSFEKDYIWKVSLLVDDDNKYAEFNKNKTKFIPKLSYAKWRKLKKLLRQIYWKK